jgi:hypothetical protein
VAGAQKHRLGPAATCSATKTFNNLSDRQIAALLNQQLGGKERDALAAMQLELAVGPIRKVVGREEGRRVHGSRWRQNKNRTSGTIRISGLRGRL